MLELAIKGNRYYWAWLALLLCIVAAGSAAYLVQFNVGLAVTGLSRDVSWGFYIAQLTFLVGWSWGLGAMDVDSHDVFDSVSYTVGKPDYTPE